MLKAILKIMRPRQWVKNVIVFFALVFDKQLFQLEPALRTLAGFALFSLISSAVYIFNDIADIEADRQHPKKKLRPLPSGELPVNVARGFGVFLVLFVLPTAYSLTPAFAAVLAIYFGMMLAYTSRLKHIPILDVMILATGFVLRVHSGVTLIAVERFSPWLYVITTLGALYLGFGKRRAELTLLEDGAKSHRRVLDGYTIPLLDQFITIVSGTTILAYSLYTFTAPNLPDNHTMMLTIPFVIYAIFRYLYLVQVSHITGSPEEVVLTDRPLQIAIILWGIVAMAVFYLS
ncbi:MAG: decaprenyl-phosphate phosphoribosyltransferase [Anaerolineae bacterium]|jgi:4-hydroxybenzoate polyprenyltransferase|nr:decaprenyl-phosphate phosphoribosyltransferase [Anaerolineae bacterium]MBT7070559.1 decaprenyl-phosphate phosphoribosyltransferase [Anaerolineae bacterium]MBT7326383.1 decaprenyl-phosphate phosphoribosyltransferase [Anaerolineae bacterium]